MFKARARNGRAVSVGGEDVVSGDVWVVSNCVELCMICRIRITAVRDCVGCYMMMLLMVVCRTVAGI